MAFKNWRHPASLPGGEYNLRVSGQRAAMARMLHVRAEPPKGPVSTGPLVKVRPGAVERKIAKRAARLAAARAAVK